ncbi:MULTISPECIES: nuclear transport factor 2 family protein [unclassified Serratia (in: enterobacteria)]|uniref:nuclear transport factor 2 family protein n=1 Tax=unclassified Serratia (in: enterobacteria) TaxID=2647522 RepID=UPI00046B0A05|nr:MULTISPECIES: nuclear transport factor 2 family protein [unclassified Serratia (in: enterobacteria)]
MQHHIEDRLQITDLMTGWIHRDLGQWEALRQLFHPDGTIEVTWFEGLARDFIDGSMRMGSSDARTKHLIGTPVVSFNQDATKAIVETNAVIVGENVKLNVGCEGHNRFYDRVEKRDGIWKLLHRQSIYDMATFTFPMGLVEIDSAVVAKYPREYAALAYMLEKSGFPVKRVFATRGSRLEIEMKAAGLAWLQA